MTAGAHRAWWSPFRCNRARGTTWREGSVIELVRRQEDVVLVPSTSRQLIGKISEAFPRAAVMVVEIEDADHGLELGGQVMRSLDAGAGGYYVTRSLDQLADVVDRALAPQQASTPQPAELTPPGKDELSSILDRLIRPEHATERTDPPTGEQGR